MKAIAHTATPDVAADADAHSAEKILVHDEPGRQVAAVAAFQVRHDLLPGFRREVGRGFDGGCALFHFEAKQTLVGYDHLDVVARLFFDQRFDDGGDPAAIETAVHEARAKKFPRKLSRLFVD